MMLMSFINMKLRDEYPSLDELCASLSVDRATLEATLATAGFEYNPTQNTFWYPKSATTHCLSGSQKQHSQWKRNYSCSMPTR